MGISAALLKLFKKLLVAILFLMAIILIYLNFRLYHKPTWILYQKASVNQDLRYQLNYLKNYLHQGGGKAAQEKYPEGFVFVNALYALSWADFIQPLPPEHEWRKEGLTEIDWALNQLNSPWSKSFFPADISPQRGIFYQGWKNYILGKKLLLQRPQERMKNDLMLFKQQSDSIFQAFNKSGSVYLESYTQLSWPADNIVAVASLALWEQMDSLNYDPFIAQWLKKVKITLDPATGLIPHEVDFGTDKVMEGARGSSQSLMLNFLQDIEPRWAQQQFNIYKDLFLDYRFGLPGIREYPVGNTGFGDVDSGPVLLGIGGSASLAGQRTMKLFGEDEIAIGLRNSIEAFGLARTTQKQKIYVLGLEPIADAFILWANTANMPEEENSTLLNWRWTFQLLSLSVLILILIAIKFLMKKNKTAIIKKQ
jgi:hypothetical protein